MKNCLEKLISCLSLCLSPEMDSKPRRLLPFGGSSSSTLSTPSTLSSSSSLGAGSLYGRGSVLSSERFGRSSSSKLDSDYQVVCASLAFIHTHTHTHTPHLTPNTRIHTCQPLLLISMFHKSSGNGAPANFPQKRIVQWCRYKLQCFHLLAVWINHICLTTRMKSTLLHINTVQK